MNRRVSTILFVPALLMALTSVPGCGGSQGGEEGATQEQMRDPAWVQSRIKELDKDPTISTGKAKKAGSAAAH